MGTPALTWRRLGVLLRQLPPESRLVRAIGGDTFAWSPEVHLLATIVDVLVAGNWQRGGGKGKRPQPIPRPGEQDKPRTDKHFGTAHPIDEARRILDSRKGVTNGS